MNGVAVHREPVQRARHHDEHVPDDVICRYLANVRRREGKVMMRASGYSNAEELDWVIISIRKSQVEVEVEVRHMTSLGSKHQHNQSFCIDCFICCNELPRTSTSHTKQQFHQ